MSTRWQMERKREHFYKKAKKEGYRSRASYKLRQLNGRYDLIEPNDTVLDLGAAPGGWLQVAGELVGEGGSVLGADLQGIEKLPYENIQTLQGDVTKAETVKRIQGKLTRPLDVILSDLSPKITGIWDVDHARSIELSRAALNIGRKLLRPGGKILLKVFQGELFQDLVKDVEESFDFTTISKPKASRKRSAETYIIGKGFYPEES